MSTSSPEDILGPEPSSSSAWESLKARIEQLKEVRLAHLTKVMPPFYVPLKCSRSRLETDPLSVQVPQRRPQANGHSNRAAEHASETPTAEGVHSSAQSVEAKANSFYTRGHLTNKECFVEELIKAAFFDEVNGSLGPSCIVIVAPTGAGKTTLIHRLELLLWKRLKLSDSEQPANQYIPLVLDLKLIQMDSGKDDRHNTALVGQLTTDDLMEVMSSTTLQPIWLLDGFDEIASPHQSPSIGFTRQLGGKFVITCGEPYFNDVLHGNVSSLLKPFASNLASRRWSIRRYLKPLNDSQIKLFIEKMVNEKPSITNTASAGEIHAALTVLCQRMKAARYPLFLRLILDQLSDILIDFPDVAEALMKAASVSEGSTSSTSRPQANVRSADIVARMMYPHLNILRIVRRYCTSFFDESQKRLMCHISWPKNIAPNFGQMCHLMCEEIAVAMCRSPNSYCVHLDQVLPMEVVTCADPQSDETKLSSPQQIEQWFVLQAIPLQKIGENVWSFHHRLLRDYFLTCRNTLSMLASDEAHSYLSTSPAIEMKTTFVDVYPVESLTNLVKSLGLMLFTQDRDLLHMHAIAIRDQPDLLQAYVAVVHASRQPRADPREDQLLVTAASNAISILNYGTVHGLIRAFSFRKVQDWSGIRVPSCNLNLAQLTKCNFDHANLSNATMFRALLYETSMRGAYLNGVSTLEIPPLRPMLDSITTAVCFSPDGSLLACATSGGRVYVWNPRTREGLLKMEQENALHYLAWSADSTFIVGATEQGDLSIWDARTGGLDFASICPSRKIECFACAPDGNHIAVASGDASLHLFRLSNREWLQPLDSQHDGRIKCVSYSPGGDLLVIGNYDGRISVYDVRTYTLRRVLTGHRNTVLVTQCHPGHHTILASASADNTVRIWDLEQKESEQATITLLRVSHAAFHPDGQLLAIAADDTVYFWDLESKQTIFLVSLPSPTGIYGIAFSASGNEIALGSSAGFTYIWQLSSAECLPRESLAPHSVHNFSCAALSADNRLVATGTASHTICVWDVTTGRCRDVWKDLHDIRDLAFSPNGQYLATISSGLTLRVFDLLSHGEAFRMFLGQQLTATSDGHILHPAAGEARDVCLRFAPNSEHLAVGVGRGAVAIINVMKQCCEKLIRHVYPSWIRRIVYSPDGQRIASGSNLEARVYNLKDQRCEHHRSIYDGKPLHHLIFDAAKDRFLAVIGHDLVEIIDLTHHQSNYIDLTWTLLQGQSLRVVKLTPDANHLVSVETGSSVVRLWSVATGQLIHELKEHGREVRSIEFSSDGNTMVTCAADGLVRIWDWSENTSMPTIVGVLQRRLQFDVTADFSQAHMDLCGIRNYLPREKLSSVIVRIPPDMKLNHQIDFLPLPKQRQETKTSVVEAQEPELKVSVTEAEQGPQLRPEHSATESHRSAPSPLVVVDGTTRQSKPSDEAKVKSKKCQIA